MEEATGDTDFWRGLLREQLELEEGRHREEALGPKDERYERRLEVLYRLIGKSW